MTTDPVAREFASVERSVLAQQGQAPSPQGQSIGIGVIQSVQAIAQNTAHDVETLGLSTIRLDALERTFHQENGAAISS